MNWAESIDLYCERTDPSLWSEPLNALTNLASCWSRSCFGGGHAARAGIFNRSTG
jgi:hypothetical protein